MAYYFLTEPYTERETDAGRSIDKKYMLPAGLGDMLSVSVCICAYNEQDNIENAVRSVYSQGTDGFEIAETIVVSSGSTDDTDDIVKKLMKEFPSLMLLRQEERKGKNHAINEFLRTKKGNISVLLNADNTLRDELSLHHLVSPFGDEKVGMTGGRPIPTNDPRTLMGFVSHFIWTMHHHAAMMEPKIGELVAFRDIDTELPTEAQSDEDIIRMDLEKRGYKSVYAPDAVVLNRGPKTIEDYMKQKVRVNIGEEHMMRRSGYSNPMNSKKLLLQAMFRSVRDVGIHPFKTAFYILLAMKAKSAARAHVAACKDDMNIWERVDSTKDLGKD
jgi:cellulose synthase/poly-beta-1,6-N-acetylglucosamine synthase-like glycosyltransferase